jgi:transcriptional antiterminator RfaH
VQTRPSQDERAEKELTNQGFEVFFPKARVAIIKAGKRDTIIRPLLRGWGFVEFDEKRDRWQPINSTRGVARLLCVPSGNGFPIPMPVREREMASLRDVVTENDNAVPVHIEPLPPISPGTIIRLLYDPFKGEHAEVEFDGPSKVKVLLLRAGALNSVTVPRDRIAIVDTAGHKTAVR